MPTGATSDIRARREAIVNAHIEAEAVTHDAAATVATFHHPRYEVPALGAIVDGAEGVNGLVSGLLAAFPDFYLYKISLRHADDAVIVEARFGGLNTASGRASNRLERKWKYKVY